jgi:beta-phosphoglucomutase family hydrolase
MDKQILELKNIQAVIFDMDGTMVNNMTYHRKAWFEFCQEHKILLTAKDYKGKYTGSKNDEILQDMFKGRLTEEEIEKYSQEKEQKYRVLYTNNVREVAGLSDLINKLKTKQIKVAIATTAPRKNREFVLESLGLSQKFDLVVGDEGLKHGKPDPEIYLNTARLLNAKPSKCLVFEDSPRGVESAKKAGMKVVGVLTTRSAKDLNQADLLIKDFTNVELTESIYA